MGIDSDELKLEKLFTTGPTDPFPPFFLAFSCYGRVESRPPVKERRGEEESGGRER